MRAALRLSDSNDRRFERKIAKNTVVIYRKFCYSQKKRGGFMKKEPAARKNSVYSFKKISIYTIMFFFLLFWIPTFGMLPTHAVIFFVLNILFFILNKNLMLALNTAFSLFVALPNMLTPFSNPNTVNGVMHLNYPGVLFYLLCLLVITGLAIYNLFKRYYNLSFFFVIFTVIVVHVINFEVGIWRY